MIDWEVAQREVIHVSNQVTSWVPKFKVKKHTSKLEDPIVLSLKKFYTIESIVWRCSSKFEEVL